jgi:hypothetical protein
LLCNQESLEGLALWNNGVIREVGCLWQPTKQDAKNAEITLPIKQVALLS